MQTALKIEPTDIHQKMDNERVYQAAFSNQISKISNKTLLKNKEKFRIENLEYIYVEKHSLVNMCYKLK